MEICPTEKIPEFHLTRRCVTQLDRERFSVNWTLTYLENATESPEGGGKSQIQPLQLIANHCKCENFEDSVFKFFPTDQPLDFVHNICQIKYHAIHVFFHNWKICQGRRFFKQNRKHDSVMSDTLRYLSEVEVFCLPSWPKNFEKEIQPFRWHSTGIQSQLDELIHHRRSVGGGTIISAWPSYKLKKYNTYVLLCILDYKSTKQRIY